MSADDHLGIQFTAHFPVERVGAMRANLGGDTMNEWAANYRAGHIGGIDTGLDDSVATHGVREPLDIDSGEGYVHDGHHRYAAALKAGRKHIPVYDEQGIVH